MTQAESLFLDLVNAGLFHAFGEGNEFISDNEVWEDVYRLAEEQCIMGLISDGIELLKYNVPRFKIPQEWALQFVGQTLQLEKRNTAMNAFIASIVSKMRAVGIYALLVKGQGIAQCYNKPLWRASGDIDFFLSTDNYQKAKSFLGPLANKTDNEKADISHLAMEIGEWEVELHGSLRGSLWRDVNKGLDEIQDAIFHDGAVRSWMNDKTQVFLPKADEDIVYVFSHILEHFFRGGIGLRQICDWCRLLWTFRAEIDIPLLKKRLSRMGIMTEWKAFAAFAVVKLGMPEEAMPLYSPEKKWLHKSQLILQYVLETGNFGHNKDNSYQNRFPYVVRKAISFWRVLKDTLKLIRIFPLDALKSWWVFVCDSVKLLVKDIKK